MVRSSYKNRKKNRKQSFKRRITGGIRDVNFIEDKMVGGDGNKQAVAALMLKYKDYPLSGLILAAFSGSACASEDECKPDATDQKNISSLKNSVYKCEAILNALPKIDGKPEIKQWVMNKDSDFITYLDECIGYILKNAFIPKDLIQKVYVQNDDGTSWTTLTNKSFKEIKSTENTTTRNAKDKANEQMQDAAAGSIYTPEPEPGQGDEANDKQNTATTTKIPFSGDTAATTKIPFSGDAAEIKDIHAIRENQAAVAVDTGNAAGKVQQKKETVHHEQTATAAAAGGAHK
jgi:hypothetical protein